MKKNEIKILSSEPGEDLILLESNKFYKFYIFYNFFKHIYQGLHLKKKIVLRYLQSKRYTNWVYRYSKFKRYSIFVFIVIQN
jgi:hypothetical protein